MVRLDGGEKAFFWEAMQLLENNSNSPRICQGDFNDLLSQDEKRVGRVVRVSSSRGLAHFTEVNGYVDLGFVGR